MGNDSQYADDRARLAELLEKHTKIPRQRTINFIKEYGVEQMLPCANILCASEAQRSKLMAVFEFKNMYDIVKQGEKIKAYTLDSPDAAMEYFCNYFADAKDREYFVAAYLDTKHDVIATKVISAGSLNSSAVYPREILKEALFCNANSVMVAHNHPSGSLAASSQDKDVTNELRKAFESTGVQLLDHFVVAGDKAISLDNGSYVHNRQSASVSRAASSIAEMTTDYKPPGMKGQLTIERNDANTRKDLETEAETTVIEAYITNLGKYNEGELCGEYLKFPATKDEVKALLARIGVDGVLYEEFFITDYETDIGGLCRYMSEYESIDELNYLANMLAELDDRDMAKFEAALEYGDYISSVEELINLAQNLDCYELSPDVMNEEDLGFYYVEQLETLSVPEHLENYIDFEAYGRDVSLNEGGVFTHNGYIARSGESFIDHYKGRHIPDEYRIFAYPETPEKMRIKEQMEMFGKMARAQTIMERAAPVREERA